MTQDAIPLAEPANIHDSLAVDTPCIHCGYNLRGLNASGRCPECGGAVVDSTRGNLLRYADPDWLETLRKGAGLKLWNIAFTIVLGLLGGIVAAMTISPIVIRLVSLIGAALGLWATFLITSQERRVSLAEDPITLRRVIRGCAIAAFVGPWIPDMGSVASASSLDGEELMVVLSVIGALLSLAGEWYTSVNSCIFGVSHDGYRMTSSHKRRRSYFGSCPPGLLSWR